MKKSIFNLLLIITAIFSFSFSAVADTNVTQDKSPSIEIAKSKTSPVAKATVIAANPGDSVGVMSNFMNYTSPTTVPNFADVAETMKTSINNHFSNPQSETARNIDLSPPISRRTNLKTTITGWLDKNFLKRTVAVAQMVRPLMIRA